MERVPRAVDAVRAHLRVEPAVVAERPQTRRLARKWAEPAVRSALSAVQAARLRIRERTPRLYGIRESNGMVRNGSEPFRPRPAAGEAVPVLVEAEAEAVALQELRRLSRDSRLKMDFAARG